MKVNRHGKPAKAYLSTLRDAGRADYQKLVNAALEAVIAGEDEIHIAFAYVLKYPADFPKGMLVRKVDDTNVRRVKAKRLLAWLSTKGYTDTTVDSLRGAIISNGLSMAAFDEMCEFPVQMTEDAWQRIGTASTGTTSNSGLSG